MRCKKCKTKMVRIEKPKYDEVGFPLVYYECEKCGYKENE